MIKKHLDINIAQVDIINADPQANILKYSQLISQAIQQPDIWVFPETFVTGFASIYPDMAQSEQGEVLQWLKSTAQEHNTAICASMLVNIDRKIYNRMYLVESCARVQHYDKRHLFSYGDEQKYITPGDNRVIWEFEGWRIMPCVCYDLRFPVWLRNDRSYELMICVANWPASRIIAWDTLLKARAIENVSYVVGVNRVGRDSLGSHHDGHSDVFTPYGKSLMGDKHLNECVLSVKLSYDRVYSIREKYGFLEDRDCFEIEI